MGDPGRDGASVPEEQHQPASEQQASTSGDQPRRLPRIIDLEPELLTRHDKGVQETRDRSQSAAEEE
jgi:hypothetical protein